MRRRRERAGRGRAAALRRVVRRVEREERVPPRRARELHGRLRAERGLLLVLAFVVIVALPEDAGRRRRREG